MGRRFDRDFLVEVAKGNIAGHRLIHKFGRNDAVPNGNWAILSLGPTESFSLQAGTTVRVKAGNGADIDGSGAGARKVTVQGIIAGTFIEDTEVLACNGTSAGAAGSKSFLRVHRAWVSDAGTYATPALGAGAEVGANTGDVIIENSAGTKDLIKIGATEGQSMYTGYTMPAGETGFVIGTAFSVDSGKNVNLKMYTREAIDDTTAPVTSKRAKNFYNGVVGTEEHEHKAPNTRIPEKTDIWFEAYGNAAAAKVSADFSVLIVENAYLPG